jgi:hypothetical protein
LISIVHRLGFVHSADSCHAKGESASALRGGLSCKFERKKVGDGWIVRGRVWLESRDEEVPPVAFKRFATNRATSTLYPKKIQMRAAIIKLMNLQNALYVFIRVAQHFSVPAEYQ